DPGARPTTVVGGDIIYWEPGGSAVISVQRAPATEEHLSVRILQRAVGRDTTQELFADPDLSGDILSVGAGGNPPVVYFTVLRDGLRRACQRGGGNGGADLRAGPRRADTSPAAARGADPRRAHHLDELRRGTRFVEQDPFSLDVVVIGAGRVGTALAVLLSRA